MILRFILGVKSGDHKYLFDYVDACVKKGEAKEFVLPDPENDEISHCFRIVYDAPLNKSNQDIRVTFVAYLGG